MRGSGVLTGLLGMVVAPTLERRLGSARAGSWSIWSEVAFLILAVLVFAYQIHYSGTTRIPAASSILLYGGACILLTACLCRNGGVASWAVVV